MVLDRGALEQFTRARIVDRLFQQPVQGCTAAPSNGVDIAVTAGHGDEVRALHDLVLAASSFRQRQAVLVMRRRVPRIARIAQHVEQVLFLRAIRTAAGTCAVQDPCWPGPVPSSR